MARTWITPKTDWTKSDKFTIADYNRIRNNLLYLNDVINEKYPDKAQPLDLGDAMVYSGNYYPSNFNAFEDALESFTRIGRNVNIGSKKTFAGNVSFIDYNELIRLESCCLRWYNLSPAVESVTISPTSFELNRGEQQQLTVTVVPTDAEYTLRWISSNTNYATVDDNGLVTVSSTNYGNFTISAVVSQQGREDKIAVANGVIIVPVTGITVDVDDLVGHDGISRPVHVSVQPSNATHRGDWEVSIGNGQKGEVALSSVKSSDTLFYITFKLSESDSGVSFGNSYYADYIIDNTVDVPITVSLEGCSTTFTATLIPNGTSYYNSKMYNRIDSPLIGMKIVKKGTSASQNVHLMYKSSGMCNSGNPIESFIDNYDDRRCNYRTYIEKYVDFRFSNDLRNALKTFNKNVYTNRTTISSYSAKFHLLALNEIGGYARYSDEPIPALGNDTYPYIMSSDELMFYQGSTYTRSRGFENTALSSTPSVIYVNDDGIGSDKNYWFTLDNENPVPIPNAIFIVNIVGDTKVKFVGTYNNTNIYIFDWTGQSSTSLYDIPLGSEIFDATGKWDNRRQCDSIVVKDGDVECSQLTLSVGQSKTLNVEILPSYIILSDAYIVYDIGVFNVVVSGNTITITRKVTSNRRRIDVVIDDCYWSISME